MAKLFKFITAEIKFQLIYQRNQQVKHQYSTKHKPEKKKSCYCIKIFS